MKIYISGKITGSPRWKEKFARAENALREKYPDAVILNPAILPDDMEYEDYMHIQFAMIDCADMICFLNDATSSPGAMREMYHWLALGKRSAQYTGDILADLVSSDKVLVIDNREGGGRF